MRSNAPHLVDEVIRRLRKRYGVAKSFGRSRLYRFGDTLTCSINYSKQLRGNKYFFGLAPEAVDSQFAYPNTKAGAFVILICGSADKVLMLPRELVLGAMRKVPTRKLDVFTEGETYILQTTGHPKVNVTEFLNAFPATRATDQPIDETIDSKLPDRAHVKIQSGLIQLGRAEGCSVWVPPGDRNLSYKGHHSCLLLWSVFQISVSMRTRAGSYRILTFSG